MEKEANKHFWDSNHKDIINELISLSKKINWREAAQKVIKDKYKLNYLIGDNRSNFKEILNLSKDDIAVDYGSGWGSISIDFSKKVKQVYSMDLNKDLLEFINIRRKQEGIKNIKTILIEPLDFGKIPLEDNSVSVFVMNGVLEWIGKANQDMNPKEVQKLALKEIKRVLKPGGKLYVGIENRFGYSSFFGGKDHSGLAFTSLIPKRLASVYTKMILGEPYRTYIYTLKGFKKLFRDSGFNNIEAFYPLPSYREPYRIIPINERKIISGYLKNQNFSKKILLEKTIFNLHLEKLFFNSFGFICKKE